MGRASRRKWARRALRFVGRQRPVPWKQHRLFMRAVAIARNVQRVLQAQHVTAQIEKNAAASKRKLREPRPAGTQ